MQQQQAARAQAAQRQAMQQQQAARARSVQRQAPAAPIQRTAPAYVGPPQRQGTGGSQGQKPERANRKPPQ
jgi:hypothetical protein